MVATGQIVLFFFLGGGGDYETFVFSECTFTRHLCMYSLQNISIRTRSDVHRHTHAKCNKKDNIQKKNKPRNNEYCM